MTQKKILIIDDECDLVEILALRLQAEGFEVDTSSDPVQGVGLAITNHYDVVILDLIMPVMDGWQVCQKLRENEMTQKIPIIIVTAAASKDIEEKAKFAGASKVLLKPFDEKELIALAKTLSENPLC